MGTQLPVLELVRRALPSRETRRRSLLFQAAIFLLFLLADLAPHLRRQAAGWEEWIRLAVNPFVFYATCYFLLNDDHHDWMAPLALVLAIVYAALARAELALRPSDRRILLVTVGTALTFVTLAIPVQLESNWITIAWGVEGAAAVVGQFRGAGAAALRCLSGDRVFAGPASLRVRGYSLGLPRGVSRRCSTAISWGCWRSPRAWPAPLTFTAAHGLRAALLAGLAGRWQFSGSAPASRPTATSVRRPEAIATPRVRKAAKPSAASLDRAARAFGAVVRVLPGR